MHLFYEYLYIIIYQSIREKIKQKPNYNFWISCQKFKLIVQFPAGPGVSFVVGVGWRLISSKFLNFYQFYVNIIIYLFILRKFLLTYLDCSYWREFRDSRQRKCRIIPDVSWSNFLLLKTINLNFVLYIQADVVVWTRISFLGDR